MESRLELLERAVMGSPHGPDTGELHVQIERLESSLRSLEANRPELTRLVKDHKALVHVGQMAQEELLSSNKERIEEMCKQLEDVKNMAKTIDQEPLANLSAKELQLLAVKMERKAIHEEIVQLLQAYSTWIDSVSEEISQASPSN